MLALAPVNSSVRFLLNDQTQETESAILNLTERKIACVPMHLEWCEPRARVES